MITRFFHSLYALVLRTIGIAESRCSYCGKRYGFKYGRNFRSGQMKPFYVSHGICKPCSAIYFPVDNTERISDVELKQFAAELSEVTRRHTRQRQSKRNMRHRLGGWSGAAAR